MAERTRYDHVRRMLALLAVAGAIVLLIRQSCGSSNRPAFLHLRLGEAASTVRSLRADVFGPTGKSVAFFERAFPGGAPEDVAIELRRAADGEYRVEVMLTTTSGVVRASRTAQIEGDAAVDIELERDALGGPP